MANTLLEVSGRKVAYGGIQAVKGVSFEVQEGERVSLIGAVLRTPRFKSEERAIAARAQQLLDYVGIGKYAEYKARTLSYGDQHKE